MKTDAIPVAEARRRGVRNKATLVGWLMVLPALSIRAFTTLYPTITTIVYGFMEYSKLYNTRRFVGFANFARIAKDPKVLASIQFTLVFTASSVVLQVVLGVLLALLLNYKFGGQRYIRTVALVPWAIPMIVAGIAASWAFNDMYGIINDFIRRFLSGFHFDWLVSVSGARCAVIMVDLWKSLPFFAILVLAALQGIAQEQYESARIDGANPIRIFFCIVIPEIRTVVLTLMIFVSLWRLTSFEVVYSMTKGGPGNATSLLAYRIYEEAFKTLNFGYASSINVMLFAIMSAFGLGGLTLVRRLD